MTHSWAAELPADYATTRSRATRGARAMLGRHVAIAIMSLVGTTYLARELGPVAWGGFAISYFLLVSADTLLSRNVLAGLSRASVSAEPQMLGSAARLSVYTGIALAAALAVVPSVLHPFYGPPRFGLLMAASAICMVLYAARALPLILLERELRYRTVAVGEVVEMAAFYAVAVAGVAMGHGLAAVAAATMARGFAALTIIRACQRAPLLGTAVRRAAQVLLPFGVPLVAVTVVGVIDGLIPVLVIGDSEREVGFLVVAASILGYGIAALSVLQRVGIPAFARLSFSEMQHAVGRSVIVGSFLTFAVMLPAGALAGLWVEPLLGAAWGEGVLTIELVALGLLAAGPIGVLTAALTGAGLSRSVLGVQVAVTSSYLIGALALVGLLGPIGCAAGFAASRWGWALILVVVSSRRLGITPSRQTLMLFATGVPAYGALLATASGSVPLAFAPIVVGLWLLSCRRQASITFRAVTSTS